MTEPTEPLEVFISYAREDRDRASHYAQWCTAHGWSVWWDQAIAPGRKWDQAIERALNEARCVLVLWSNNSVKSDWVKTEASEAARRGVLVPVMIDRVAPPLEFRRVQALDMAGWDGRPDEPALALLRNTLAEHIGRSPALPATPPPRPRPWRWAVTGVAVLVGLVALGVWKLQQNPAATPPASTKETLSGTRPVDHAASPASPDPPVPVETNASASTPHQPRQTAPLTINARAGADIARIAEEQRRALLNKFDESTLYWPYMLKDEGGSAMLEQAVLLGVEAVRRGGGAAADTALRRSLALLPQPMRVLAHGDAVTSVAFSPDFRMMATASSDWTAALWEVNSGRKIATLQHQEPVNHIAFSPDGRLVATASDDKTARLWQASDGKELARLQHADRVRWVMFSGDGRAIVTTSNQDRALIVWSVPEGREVRRIVPSDWMEEVILSDDGRYLIGRLPSGYIAPVQVWDVTSGERVAELSAGSSVQSIATHRDLLAVSERKGVSLWQLGSWVSRGEVREVGSDVTIALSADARLLAIGSFARYGQVFSAPVSDGVTRATRLSARKNGGIRRVALSADASRVVVSAIDQTAVVIDLRSGEELLRARVSEYSPAVLSPDGRLLLTAGNGGAALWEVTPKDLLGAACVRVTRNLTPEEWRRWFVDEPWRKTCGNR